jgi:uncharacterized protein
MVRPRRSTARKTIFDPVHGTIALTRGPLELVGHPAFQRLWGIRQTGFAHLVFPGANHTRLEHSLGVFWVAQSMAEALGLDPSAAALVSAGGLLHDLGHGPFSHTLDPSMREAVGYGHEHISREWILGTKQPVRDEGDRTRSIPEILEGLGIRPADVASLIDPLPRSRERPLLRAMLHGAIDADRIDYLQRDAHYTGVAYGAIDAGRLLATVRASRGHLAFVEKGRSALEGFLVGRALMYSSVYYHKTVRAAEVMAQSAVERLPDYPASATPLFDLTDGELIYRLLHRGDRASAVVQGLLSRRLFKRAFGVRRVPASERKSWLRIAHRPSDRRQLEDELAARVRAPSGSVLLDLSGLEQREPGEEDWSEVTVLEGAQETHPFRAPSLWRSLALRPPTLTPVAVYVDPRYRSVPDGRWARWIASAV